MWRSVPSVPVEDPAPRVSPWLSILVPVAVAALLWFLGHHPMAIVVLVVGGALAISARVSRAAERAIARAGAWLGHVVSGILSVVLLGAVFYTLFTLVSVILRLIGRDPTRSEPSPSRSSYWVRLHPSAERSMPRWQFGRESEDVDARGASVWRAAVTFAIAVVGINLAAGVALRAIGADGWRRGDARADAAAYDDASWTADYFRELEQSRAQRYAGFAGWRRKDFSGEYIRVAGGLRATPTSRDAAVATVFFFGGSTMWGEGNRDAHTIPSAFAELAAADALPVRAVNYGESAYVSWQEAMLLAERCAAGDVPDLAIFYDGVNDVFAQLQRPSPEPAPQNYRQLEASFEDRGFLPVLKRFSGLHVLANAFRPATPRTWYYGEADLPAPADTLAGHAVDIYEAAIAHAGSIGARYGFDVAAFWQPCVYTKVRLVEDEPHIRDGFGPGLGTVYAAATARLRGGTHVITGALDELDGPTMIDWCHTDEDGARAVATAIYERVRPLLQARGTGSGTRP